MRPKTHGGARRGAGRPPRADGPAAEMLTIRLTEAEMGEAVAAAGDEPVRAWARGVVMAAARRKKR